MEKITLEFKDASKITEEEFILLEEDGDEDDLYYKSQLLIMKLDDGDFEVGNFRYMVDGDTGERRELLFFSKDCQDYYENIVSYAVINQPAF
jgi:hypothetical protein